MILASRILAFVILAIVPTAIGLVLLRLDRKGKFRKGLQKTAARVGMAAMALIVFVMLVLSMTVPIDQGDDPRPEEAVQAQAQSESPEPTAPAPAPAEPEPEPTASGTLTAHFIDVGQGDSSFYQLPDGKTMLVDASTRDAGQTVVSYLRNLGVTRIDYLVATHPHEDHIGGMPDVIAAFDIGEVWAPRATHTTQTYEDFLTSVASKGLSITTATAGKTMYDSPEAGCRIDVLSPAEGANPDDLNDWSVIQKITFGNTSFLLTGDAGASLIEGAAGGHVDVLKVGHHGSSTSTTPSLASLLSPQIAVISCGADNSYGHPHREALEALASSAIYRTDLNGSVVVTSDGTTVQAAPQRTADSSAIMTPGSDSSGGAGGSSSGSGSSAAASAAAASAVSSAPAPASGSDGGMTVYVTRTGAKYHLDGCSSLSKSKIPTTLDQAKADGYTPCKRCNPPA